MASTLSATKSYPFDNRVGCPHSLPVALFTGLFFFSFLLSPRQLMLSQEGGLVNEIVCGRQPPPMHLGTPRVVPSLVVSAQQ